MNPVNYDDGQYRNYTRGRAMAADQLDGWTDAFATRLPVDSTAAARGTTHEVRMEHGRGVVIKRFRSWVRAEPVLEWTALRLLAELAPGLAPVPLRDALTTRPPWIEMSWLPGTRLGDAAPSQRQTEALAAAMQRLWRSVPPAALRASADAAPNAVRRTGQVRATLAAMPELGGGALASRAYGALPAWLGSAALDRQQPSAALAVLGHGDPNLANFLWDDGEVRIVDFEDSGPSSRAFELASLVEHLSTWLDAGLAAEPFLGPFDLTSAERFQLRGYRRLAALFWLLLLRPGGPASRRNPPGTLERQAERLLTLLG